MTIRGYLERVERGSVRGWAQDADNERPLVSVSLDGRRVGEGYADQRRDDLAKTLSTDGRHVFSITLDEPLPADALERVICEVHGTSGSKQLPRVKRPARKHSYQDFDGTGASKSAAKLAALRLDELYGASARSHTPLAGKAVLDIGCNEGFFCAEAVRQGARRVLGIDAARDWIDKARDRVPGAEFKHGSWWDIPDEKFDVIFFLSAIHYEPEQKRLLAKLATHLTEDGVLVLECGVSGKAGKKQWTVVPRWDGEKKYPSLDLLRDDLLADYGVRSIGASVAQAGDPVPRYVFHCRPRRPVAMVIAGRTHAGKTALAHTLLGRGIPNYDSDTAIAKLLVQEELSRMPLSAALLKKFGKGNPSNLSLVGQYMVDNGLFTDFVKLIVNEVPIETGLFCIEGEIFRHENVQKELFEKLTEAGIRAWLVERAN